MPDEQDRWLDRETAERLLSGRLSATADTGVRARAEALAGLLRALTPDPLPDAEKLPDGELPGEAAAVAAFHAARAAGGASRAYAAGDTPVRATGDAYPASVDGDARPEYATGTPPGDLPLVRTTRETGPASGRRRARRRARRRPLRVSLATVLAVGMAGGVAVGASTGVVQMPFVNRPEPSATVSADLSPAPLTTPRPGTGGEETGPDGDGVPSTGEWRGSTWPDEPGNGHPGAGSVPREVTRACRDLHQGRHLEADARQVLDEAAGDTPVRVYCAYVLHDGPGPSSGVTPGPWSGWDGNGRQDEDGDEDGDGRQNENGSGSKDQADSASGRQKGTTTLASGRQDHQEYEGDQGGDHDGAGGSSGTLPTLSPIEASAGSPRNSGHAALTGPKESGTAGGSKGRTGQGGAQDGRGGQDGQGNHGGQGGQDRRSGSGDGFSANGVLDDTRVATAGESGA